MELYHTLHLVLLSIDLLLMLSLVQQSICWEQGYNCDNRV